MTDLDRGINCLQRYIADPTQYPYPSVSEAQAILEALEAGKKTTWDLKARLDHAKADLADKEVRLKATCTALKELVGNIEQTRGEVLNCGYPAGVKAYEINEVLGLLDDLIPEQAERILGEQPVGTGYPTESASKSAKTFIESDTLRDAMQRENEQPGRCPDCHYDGNGLVVEYCAKCTKAMQKPYCPADFKCGEQPGGEGE